MARDTLVEAARSGNQAALERLLTAWRPRVVAWCLRAGGRIDVAEDLAQEVLLRACRALPRLRDTARFEPWLRRLARSVVSDWLRRGPGPGPLVGEPAAVEDRADLLAGAPACCAEALRLHYLEGHSLGATAARLGLPATTVKSRLQLGRRWLRETMNPTWMTDRLAARRRRWLESLLHQDGDGRYTTALAAMREPPVWTSRLPAAEVLLVEAPGPVTTTGDDLGRLRDELRYHGFPATWTRSAAGLVARLRRDRPDVLVLGDGVDADLWGLLRDLRVDRATRGVTVLLLLGAGSDRAAWTRAWQAGVDCLLTKPVDVLEAAEFVTRLDAQLRARDLEVLATDLAWRGEPAEALACLGEAVAAGGEESRRRAWANLAFRTWQGDPAFVELVGPRPEG